jgi:hypothetical protein
LNQARKKCLVAQVANGKKTGGSDTCRGSVASGAESTKRLKSDEMRESNKNFGQFFFIAAKSKKGAGTNQSLNS